MNLAAIACNVMHQFELCLAQWQLKNKDAASAMFKIKRDFSLASIISSFSNESFVSRHFFVGDAFVSKDRGRDGVSLVEDGRISKRIAG